MLGLTGQGTRGLMLFQKRNNPTSCTLLAGILLATIPVVAVADTDTLQAGDTSTINSQVLPVPLFAQLAEDENVEDVLRSEPRRGKPQRPQDPAAATAETSPESVTSETRSEEHRLNPSHVRIPYAVVCLKK